MADINWIKLRVDMFDDEKIKIIQSMPEGDAILVIWIRIIALAGKCNAKGLVLIEDEFPYSDEMLATIFNKPLATVRLALGTFEKFRMIERTEKGIYISNFEKHQNTEGMEKIREQARIRKQREREKKRALLEAGNTPALPENSSENPETLPENVTDNVTSHVTSRVTEREVTKQNKNKNKNIYNICVNCGCNTQIRIRLILHINDTINDACCSYNSRYTIYKRLINPAIGKLKPQIGQYYNSHNGY